MRARPRPSPATTAATRAALAGAECRASRYLGRRSRREEVQAEEEPAPGHRELAVCPERGGHLPGRHVVADGHQRRPDTGAPHVHRAPPEEQEAEQEAEGEEEEVEEDE